MAYDVFDMLIWKTCIMFDFQTIKVVWPIAKYYKSSLKSHIKITIKINILIYKIHKIHNFVK